MKRILKAMPVIVLTFAIGSLIGLRAKANDISNKLIRFRIVANDNSDEAQEIKWEIRKKIFEYFEETDLKSMSSKEEATAFFKKEKSKIKEIADGVLKNRNLSYKSKVFIEKKSFPVKKYNSFVLPAGIYDAVSIVLGDGGGENFFCVMYPSVCEVSSISENTNDNSEKLGCVLSETETELVTDVGNKTVFKLKLLEIVEKFLSN